MSHSNQNVNDRYVLPDPETGGKMTDAPGQVRQDKTLGAQYLPEMKR
jgi:hypothetical protein